MKINFKRITSTGRFIPEIDGLRFIAIASVLLYHVNGFINVKDNNEYVEDIDYSFLQRILSHGDLGVPLFFVISGFILGLPFAKYYINNHKPVNIKQYFLRRLTRLEPAYILVMSVLLLGAVYVANTLSLQEGVSSYLASIIYSHEMIFNELPKLNVSAWSLEVEVQFYILAPLLALVFSIKSISIRRSLIILIGTIFILINFYLEFPFRSLVNYIQYFLIGFLLVDMYVTKSTLFKKRKFDYLIALFFFCIIWIFDESDFSNDFQKFMWVIIQITSMFFLNYYVLFHKVFRLLSFKYITAIGGMCYSIYLLHYPIISMFGNPLLSYSFSKYAFLNTTIYTFILLLIVMVISSVFFLLIERPTMDKEWPKKLINVFKSKPKSKIE